MKSIEIYHVLELRYLYNFSFDVSIKMAYMHNENLGTKPFKI